jgi:hypothetical protein
MRRVLRHLSVFLMLVLACASINFLIAIRATRYEHVPLPARVNLRGAQAAAVGWPDGASSDWPPVAAWSDSAVFAFRQRRASAEDSSGTNSHVQVSQEYGWPVAVLSRTRRWWPNMPPGAAGNPAHDSGLQFRWTGIVVNPLLAAAALWLTFFAPFLLWQSWRAGARRRRGQCVACGYQVGTSGVCTECGVVVPAAA